MIGYRGRGEVVRMEFVILSWLLLTTVCLAIKSYLSTLDDNLESTFNVWTSESKLMNPNNRVSIVNLVAYRRPTIH